MSKKRKLARQNDWSKIILKQIDECQLKLFGKEQPKREYHLNNQAQEIIVKYYEDKNPNLKKTTESYKKLKPHKRKGNIVVLKPKNKIFFK